MTASYIDQGKFRGDEFDLRLAVHCDNVRYTGAWANSIQNAMNEEIETSSSQVVERFVEWRV